MAGEKNLEEWMTEGKYLPEFMRDFHDGKDVFKTIHEVINMNETANKIGFRDGMIYTVDVFLWFMARRGYTLQKSRVKLPFRDMDVDIAQATKHRQQRVTDILKQQLAVAPQSPTES